MATYTKSTNFTAKDTLPTGDPAKKVKGIDFDVEFNNIATAVNSKVNTDTAALTGTPTAPTAVPGTATTQIATTAFVDTSFAKKGANADITSLTTCTTITGLTTPLSIAQGGTGGNSEAAAKAALNLEIGTDVMAHVAPGTPGNVLTSDGTNWTSAGLVGFACRVWVNFNGTGTVAIRASGNVSSITDNGTGDYTVNFITAMPDADYCVSGTCSGADTPSNNAASLNTKVTGGLTTTDCRVFSTNNSGSAADREFIAVAIFR